MDLTVGSGERYCYVALTLEEADRLRVRLTELIAHGREYARPEAVPSLAELIAHCGVHIVELGKDVAGFHGCAVGDTAAGGPVWVTVPKGTTGPRLENLVTEMLAEVHESQSEITDLNGTAVPWAGDAPGASERGPWKAAA